MSATAAFTKSTPSISEIQEQIKTASKEAGTKAQAHIKATVKHTGLSAFFRWVAGEPVEEQTVVNSAQDLPENTHAAHAAIKGDEAETKIDVTHGRQEMHVEKREKPKPIQQQKEPWLFRALKSLFTRKPEDELRNSQQNRDISEEQIEIPEPQETQETQETQALAIDETQYVTKTPMADNITVALRSHWEKTKMRFHQIAPKQKLSEIWNAAREKLDREPAPDLVLGA